ENRQAMRDVSDDIKALRGRLGEAREYLRIDDLRARRPQLETEASRPDLWVDADVARKVTGELAQVTDDLDLWDGLAERIEDAEVSPGSEAGISSATFMVKGRDAYGWLRSEHGVHRLVRMSPFNAQGKRQTAFAALKVTPFLEDVPDIVIDDKELRIDVYRS